MSAKVLRRAAALIREDVPPRVDIDREGTCDGCAEHKHLVASYPEPDSEPWVCADCCRETDTLLALAALLDTLAHKCDLVTGGHICFEDEVAALTVARAYLGEQS